MKSYGKELILDIHECNSETFTRVSIESFFDRLCVLIDMKRGPLHFWDDVGVPEEEKQTEPHLKGTTAVQFIITSSVVLHSLDILKTVHINLFSCKDYSVKEAADFIEAWFEGEIVHLEVVKRI